MADFKPNPNFTMELAKRSQIALKAAGEWYLARMADTLSNSPARTGRAYWWYQNRLRPMTSGPKWGMKNPWKLGKKPRSTGGKGRIHIASRKGEPPALLTGELRKRRAKRLADASNENVVIEFGSNVPYAHRLEYGMDRPAWESTMKKYWDNIMYQYASRMKQQSASDIG